MSSIAIAGKKAKRRSRSYAPRFEVKRTGNAWWWHVVASNGEILAHSETYGSKRGVLRAVQSVKRAQSVRVVSA